MAEPGEHSSSPRVLHATKLTSPDHRTLFDRDEVLAAMQLIAPPEDAETFTAATYDLPANVLVLFADGTLHLLSLVSPELSARVGELARDPQGPI
jgi:hypothetical protein